MTTEDSTTTIDPGAEAAAVEAAAVEKAAAEAATAEAATAEAAAAEKPAAEPAALLADWHQSVPEEDREFAQRFPLPAELTRQAKDWRSKLSSAIVVPGKDASPEDIATYRKALGVPETPDDYKLKLGEDLVGEEGSDNVKAVLAKAHELGVQPQQLQGLFDVYGEMLRAGAQADEAALNQAADETRATLIQEWGGPELATAKAESVKETQAELGGPDFKAFMETVELDGMLLGDHPVMLRAWANVASMLGEARPLIGVTEEQRSSLEVEAEQLRHKQYGLLEEGKHAEAQAVDKQLMAIMEKLHGAGPIVGEAGRTT